LQLNKKDIIHLQHKVAYLKDEKSYKSLYYHFYPSLFRFSFSLLKRHELAEEAVSDVMLKIWDMGSKLAQVEQLNLYLFTSIRNTCYSIITKEKLNKPTVDTEILVNNLQIIDSETPETKALYIETESVIENAVEHLPNQAATVFRLIKEEGLSYKEVSAILGISQNTIETHMRIALKKIRVELVNYLHHKK